MTLKKIFFFSFLIIFGLLSAQNTKSADPIPYPSLKDTQNQTIISSNKSPIIGSFFNPNYIPLIIVNDLEIDRQTLEKIDPNKILSMDVLKDENAILKYGEKGKNGVIILKAKKKFKIKNQTDILKLYYK